MTVWVKESKEKKTYRFHLSVHAYSSNVRKTSKRGENVSQANRLWLVAYSYHVLTSVSVLSECTCAAKWNLFVILWSLRVSNVQFPLILTLFNQTWSLWEKKGAKVYLDSQMPCWYINNILHLSRNYVCKNENWVLDCHQFSSTDFRHESLCKSPGLYNYYPAG